MVSNVKSLRSFGLHGAFDSEIGELLGLGLDSLDLSLNDSSTFASDHALIGADYPLDAFKNTETFD